MSKDKIKIIHTSDLHLGADWFNGSEEVMQRSVEVVIDTVISEHADVLLIAGDLLDSYRIQPEVMSTLEKQFNRLDIPIVLLPGNHDCLDDDSVYKKVDLPAKCPSLYMFAEPKGEIISISDLDLSFWGKPTVDHTPQFYPLEGSPSRNGDRWMIGVAHGLFAGDKNNDWRSSPILSSHISESNFDYVALGHVHVFRDVSQGNVPAYYSGAPIGAGTRESHGCVALVELDYIKGVSVRPLALPAIRY